MIFNKYDYDLKNEIEQFRNSTKDNIYKFLIYKSDTSPFDCDRCDYAKSIYCKLWGFDNNIPDSFQYIKVGKNEILMGMDTMNSFWTTFAWILNTWCHNDMIKEFGLSRVTAKSAGELLLKYDTLKAIIVKNLSLEIYNKLNDFASLTHTIGNLLLVPKKVAPYTSDNQTFNTARASKWNDYFDLSLLWLYQNEEEVWNVETLMLYRNIFVLDDYISNEGRIIPFNDKHRQIIAGNTSLESRPQSKQELIELLDNINSRIIHRGQLLYAKLIETAGTRSKKECR